MSAIEQRLNEQIPPDLTFRDETGKTVRLGDYFGKRPMILNLVYYTVSHAVRRSFERPDERDEGHEAERGQRFRRADRQLRSE